MKISQLMVIAVLIMFLNIMGLNFCETKAADMAIDLSPEYFINAIDMERIRRHIRFFSSLGSRVTGYPGSYRAAQYIYDKFLEYGLSHVQFHNYSITVPIDYGANVEVLSSKGNVQRVLNAYTLWPNSVQTSPTPPEGLTGKLIYGGYGSYSDFDGKDVNGSIVLMEFNSRDNWRRAFKLGAKAVIFIEPEDTSRFEVYSAPVFNFYDGRTYELKYLSIPLYAPRLLISREDGLYLRSLADKGINVRVHSNMQYEVKEAVNVIGVVNGTGLPDNPDLANETVIISAKYDSLSVVPALSPGADEAVGIAVLLELARLFKENPPARTVMFLATSGHDLGLEGVRWFVEDLVFEKKFGDPSNYRLFIGLELSSESPELAGLMSGYFYRWYPSHESDIAGCTGIYSAIYNEYVPQMREAWMRIYGESWSPDFSATVQRRWHLHNIPPGPYLPSEAWTQIGMSGFSFVTRLAPRIHYNTWLDTYELVNFDNIRPQAEFIAFSTHALLCRPEITGLSRWESAIGSFHKLIGQIVEFDPLSAKYRPVPNALVHLWLRLGTTASIAGARETVVRADENGIFTVVGLSGWVNVRAYVLNSTGAIIYAPDFGEYGEIEYPTFLDMWWRDYGSEAYPRYFVVFRTGTLVLYNFINPFDVSDLSNGREIQGFVDVLDARTHIRPTSYGYVGYDNILMVFAPPEVPVEILIKVSSKDPYPTLILGNWSEEEGIMRGYLLREGETRVVGLDLYRSAHDIYHLVESRKTILDQFNVISSTLKRYHQTAEEKLEMALAALKSKRYGKYTIESISAWQNECLAYSESMQILGNVINTTIFFFVLLIPFAFLAERLLIHGETWKMRVGSMILIFAVSTLVLSMLHPGFKLASNIYMTLIGFVALLFTLPLLFIVWGEVMNIFAEMRKKIVGEHFLGISRFSAVTASFGIGIENMRTRSFRTTLTLLSISIISMCLITFTSLSGLTIVRIETVQEPTPYTGIMLKMKDNSWNRHLSERFVEYCKNLFPDKIVSYRVWMRAPTDREENPLQMPVISETGEKRIVAVLGLTADELAFSPFHVALSENSRWFTEYDYNVALLPDTLAKELNVHVGETIKWWGYQLTVIGIYDSYVANKFTDLDREEITPLDPSAPAGMRAHLPTTALIIVPARFLLDIGGVIQVVNVKFSDSAEALEVAKEIARTHTVDVYAGAENIIYHTSAGVEFSVSGMQYLIVPLLIACLTIFNMSLASIMERSEEIFIYSSVGLSPLHVAGMFISESVVYAIVGGVLGYILGVAGIQAAFLLNLYPEGFYPNFTSTWIIITSSFMMLAVILSTLYPVYKSSRMVTPSLERKWKLTTKPIGDNWEIPYPFLIPDRYVDGQINFIAEYLSSHTVEGVGPYTVSNLKLSEGTEGKREYKALSMKVRLEPYEEGINQKAVIYLYREREAKYWRCNLLITRLSGNYDSWKRNNREFIDEIRKQLLLWSSMSPQAKEKYIKKEIKGDIS